MYIKFRKFGWFASLLLILLASCTANTSNVFNKPEPKELYRSYIEKSESFPEYSLLHKVEIKNKNFFNDTKIGSFKKDKREKIVVELLYGRMLLKMSEFRIEGTNTFCSSETDSVGEDNISDCTNITGDPSKNSGDSGIIAMLKFLIYPKPDINSADVTVVYLGQSKIINRECDKFQIESSEVKILYNINANDNFHEKLANKFFNVDSSTKMRLLNIETCLDKKSGLPLYTKISGGDNGKSELDTKVSTTDLLTMTATSFTENVGDSKFLIPPHKEVRASDIGSALPSRCVLQPGIGCLDYRVNPNQIDLKLVNGMGFDIGSIKVRADSCGSTDTPSSLQNGVSGTFTIKCGQTLNGTRYVGKINFEYAVAETGLRHINTGQLVTRIEPIINAKN